MKSGGLLGYVERHPWFTLLFLVAGGNAIAAVVAAARGVAPKLPATSSQANDTNLSGRIT